MASDAALVCLPTHIAVRGRTDCQSQVVACGDRQWVAEAWVVPGVQTRAVPPRQQTRKFLSDHGVTFARHAFQAWPVKNSNATTIQGGRFIRPDISKYRCVRQCTGHYLISAHHCERTAKL